MPLAAAGIGAGTSLIGGLMGSSAAQNAASVQAAGAEKGAALEQENSQKALDFQNGVWNQTQSNLNPYINSGQNANSALAYGLGLGGNGQGTGLDSGSLLKRYGSFSAPTTLDEQNDPGYQARLKLGTDAIQRSAAARGGVLSGGTGKALNSYAQDYASNEYGNVYNRALQGYQTNANNYYTGQNNAYSRLMGMSNSGQQAAGTEGQLGQSASNNVTGNLMGTAQNVAQQYNNAAAATASGYVGSANAWGGALNGAGNSLSNIALLMGKGGGNSGYSSGYGSGMISGAPLTNLGYGDNGALTLGGVR